MLPILAKTTGVATGRVESMSDSLSLGGLGAVDRDRSHALFGQTMGYVAVTAGFFALGSYLGRPLSEGWAIVWFIVAFACLISMNFTVRRSGGPAVRRAQRGTAAGRGPDAGAGHGAGARLLREHEPPGALAGGRGHRPIHRRVRGGRLRHPAGPLGARPGQLLGARRADRVRHCDDLRAYP